jgi:hypothetical protein
MLYFVLICLLLNGKRHFFIGNTAIMASLFKREYQKIGSEAGFEGKESFSNEHIETRNTNGLFMRALVVVFIISVSMNALWVYQGLRSHMADTCVSNFGRF